MIQMFGLMSSILWRLVWSVPSLWVVFICLTKMAVSGPTATFTGNSYITNAMTMTSSNDVVQLDIRTKSHSSLLFYAGNNNDKEEANYILIYLQKGILHVETMFPGDIHRVKLGTSSGGRFDDNQWHTIRLERIEENLKVQVDDTVLHEHSILSKQSADGILLWTRRILLAGVGSTNQLPLLRNLKSYDGCMKQAHYKADNTNLDLLTLAHEGRHGFKVLGSISFQGCVSTFHEETITFHQPGGFLVVGSSQNSLEYYQISITFRTNQANSLLLYQPGGKTSKPLKDFLSLEVRHDYLYVIFNCNYKNYLIKFSDTKIADGSRTTASFSFRNNKATVKLNNEAPVSVIMPGSAQRYLKLTSRIYIGGVDPERITVLPNQVWNAVLGRSFTGCVLALSVNREAIDLASALESSKMSRLADPPITKGECKIMGHFKSPCDRENVCLNQGRCKITWKSFTCDCSATSYMGKFCDKKAPVATFDGTQYLQVSLPQRILSQTEELKLRFKTEYSSGLLFSTSNQGSTQNDRFGVNIVNGQIYLQYLISGNEQTAIIDSQVSDNTWHYLHILRENLSISTVLDSKKLHHRLKTSFNLLNYQGYFIGNYIEQNATEFMNSVIPFATSMKKVKKVKRVKKSPFNKYDDANTVSLWKQPFVGKLMHASFNGFDLLSSYKPNSTLHDKYIGMKSTGYLGIPTDVKAFPINFMTRSCHLTLTTIRLTQKFKLTFHFKTSHPNGVLILTKSSKRTMYLLLELVSGYLHLVIDTGYEVKRQPSSYGGLNDDMWHRVSLSREDTAQNYLVFQVDNVPQGLSARVMVNNFDINGGYELNASFYVGGAPLGKNRGVMKGLASEDGFQGCIAGLSVNGALPENLLDRPDAKLSSHCPVRSVMESGCTSLAEGQCQLSSINLAADRRQMICKHGGQCQQLWQSNLTCDCSLTTFNGPNCDIVSKSIQFGSKMKEGYAKLELNQWTNSTREVFALGLQTSAHRGTLLYVQPSEIEGDFIHLFIMDGRVKVTYNMNNNLHMLGVSDVYVSDGTYHRLKFIRNGESGLLSVDGTKHESKSGTNLSYFKKQKILWIGYSPYVKDSQSFKGIISGMVFNNLPVTDLVWDSEIFTDVVVTKFGIVRNIPNFRPNYPQGSVRPPPDSSRQNLDYSKSFPYKPPGQNDGTQEETGVENPPLVEISPNQKPKAVNPKNHDTYPTRPIYPADNNRHPSIHGISTSTMSIWLILALTCAALATCSLLVCLGIKCRQKRRNESRNCDPLDYQLASLDKYPVDATALMHIPDNSGTGSDIQSAALYPSSSPTSQILMTTHCNGSGPYNEYHSATVNNPALTNTPLSIANNNATLNLPPISSTVRKKPVNRKKGDVKEWYV